MTIRSALASVALFLIASTASASCQWGDQHAMSCADGMVYDEASQSCKAVSG